MTGVPNPSSAAPWYFDVISPYAYFASLDLPALATQLNIQPRPVLLAALLNHWGQKGPAEITPKRAWTYQWCTWHAATHDLPFVMPAAHPFNPLPYLRLTTAALHHGADALATVRTVLDLLWTTGADPGSPDTVSHAARQLGLTAAEAHAPDIKQALRDQTDEAIARDVFGVPCFHVLGHNFWGADAIPFMRDCLRNPDLLDSPPMQRARQLPYGATRADSERRRPKP